MKKLLSFLLAGTMLFSLAACGDNAEEKDDSNKNKFDAVEDGDSRDENNTATEEIDFSDADFTSTQIGDYITFGSYNQDYTVANGKEAIEWLVLDKQDGKILVISKYALDCQKFNEEMVDVTWESCSLRNWLNSEFADTAFTDGEISRIPTVTVEAAGSTSVFYETSSGNDTQDKVFLLSYKEIKKYLPAEEDRPCKATVYTKTNRGMMVSEENGYEGNCWWWLRNPGINQQSFTAINTGGIYREAGNDVTSRGGVRPAMWIEL